MCQLKALEWSEGILEHGSITIGPFTWPDRAYCRYYYYTVLHQVFTYTHCQQQTELDTIRAVSGSSVDKKSSCVMTKGQLCTLVLHRRRTTHFLWSSLRVISMRFMHLCGVNSLAPQFLSVCLCLSWLCGCYPTCKHSWVSCIIHFKDTGHTHTHTHIYRHNRQRE